MKSKYVCRGLISLYVNFHNNWTMYSKKLHVKICRWGEKEKEPSIVSDQRLFTKLTKVLILQKINKNCKNV